MSDALRVVLDTNTLVSALLLPGSVPALGVAHAARNGEILASTVTLQELAEVLARPKFDRYVTAAQRDEYLKALVPLLKMVEIVQRVRACRDPRDDKFLEVAVNGDADCIVTGDRDLLTLDPFRGISILTASRFLPVD
jgi:putative PIN family toxin of toxin-antitoxin system